jgi:hypothetical protein
MNSHVVSKEMFTRMTSAYAYGTYAPMDWLRTELVEIADKVKKQVAVIVEVDGGSVALVSHADCMAWVQQFFAELAGDVEQHFRI